MQIEISNPKRKRITKVCIMCGREFSCGVGTGRGRNTITCSHECSKLCVLRRYNGI